VAASDVRREVRQNVQKRKIVTVFVVRDGQSSRFPILFAAPPGLELAEESIAKVGREERCKALCWRRRGEAVGCRKTVRLYLEVFATFVLCELRGKLLNEVRSFASRKI
jgi:hypothetical protein